MERFRQRPVDGMAATIAGSVPAMLDAPNPPPPPRQTSPDDTVRDQMCDAIEAVIAEAFKTGDGQPIYEPRRMPAKAFTTSIVFMPPATHRPGIDVGFEVTLTYPAELSSRSNG